MTAHLIAPCVYCDRSSICDGNVLWVNSKWWSLKSTWEHWFVINCKIYTSLVAWWLTFYVSALDGLEKKHCAWANEKKRRERSRKRDENEAKHKGHQINDLQKMLVPAKMWGINFWIIYEPVRSHIHDPFQSHFSRSWRDLGVLFLHSAEGFFCGVDARMFDNIEIINKGAKIEVEKIKRIFCVI